MQQQQRWTLPAFEHDGGDAVDLQSPLLHGQALQEPVPRRTFGLPHHLAAPVLWVRTCRVQVASRQRLAVAVDARRPARPLRRENHPNGIARRDGWFYPTRR